MALEHTAADLLSEIRATRDNILSGDRATNQRIDTLEQSLNEVLKKFGRPGAFMSHDDGRARAQGWLQHKHVAEQHRRDVLQPFHATPELIDQAISARGAINKMISLQALDTHEQKSLSLFNMGASGYLVPVEWSTRI